MEVQVLIVGAGIAGLATALGLHRLGIPSLVLESSDSLRVTGFAYVTWSNAWRALDALGIGDYLRQLHYQLDGLVVASPVSGTITPERSLISKCQEQEVRSVQRTLLLQALARELPVGTIRFSSKVVAIQESGFFKLVHLVDGTILKTKVLIGCDGVNSMVSKYMGFKSPAFAGRSAVRGYAHFRENHGFGRRFCQLFSNGIRSGFRPCDDRTVYWFFTWYPSSKEKEFEEDPEKMNLFVSTKLAGYNFPDELRHVVENTELDCFFVVPLRYRHPWELVWKSASQGNMCLAGDALHPMTPEIGQGGCSALEDGVVLARCLAKALRKKASREEKDVEEEKYKEIETCLHKYAKERKWRSIDLITTAYIVGVIQQSNGLVMSFLRDKIMPGFLSWLQLKKSDFDCGKLT